MILFFLVLKMYARQDVADLKFRLRILVYTNCNCVIDSHHSSYSLILPLPSPVHGPLPFTLKDKLNENTSIIIDVDITLTKANTKRDNDRVPRSRT